MFYLVCKNCGISNEINWFCLTLSKWKSEEKTKNINDNKSNSKIVEKNQSTFLTAEAVLVIAFTTPPPLSNSVQNASNIAIMLSRHYYNFSIIFINFII